MKARTCLLAILLVSTSVSAREPGPWLFEYDARLAFGLGYRLSDMAVPNLAMETSATFRVGLEERFENEWTLTLMPELGYVGFVDGVVRNNYFTTGIGVGLTFDDWFVIGLVPSVLVGTHNDPKGGFYTSSGFRISMVAELIWAIGVQATVQMVGTEGSMVPELQLTASMNLLPVLVILYIGGN